MIYLNREERRREWKRNKKKLAMAWLEYNSFFTKKKPIIKYD